MLTRHLLHLSNTEMVCVPWQFGHPLAEHRFRADPAGLAAFGAYLARWQNVPVLLAVDLIEEDFRIETLPHLRGGDRRTVVERRLNQLYRSTPFRMAVQQGREASGRRDDIVLCTAITQSEAVSTWLDALQAQRIPLLGVYTTALLGEGLLRAVGLPDGQVLLVVPLGPGAVRISFFQGGRLKFSRISEPAAGLAGDRIERIREETRKTLQYVAAQPWYQRNSSLRTLVVADVDDARRVTSDWSPDDAAVQAVTPGTLARRLRLRALPEGASATAILLALLMQRPPRSQLAPRERTRDGLLWYARSALFGLTALTAVCACVLAAANLLHALQVRAQQEPLRAALLRSQGELERLQTALPPSPTAPDRMSAAVHFYQNEVVHRPQLVDLLQPVAEALDANPAISLQRLSWTVSAQPPPARAVAGRDAASLAFNGSGGEPLLRSALPHPFYVEARVEGELPGLNNAPDRALRTVDDLARRLRRPGTDVQLLRPPFDVDPTHALVGDAVAGAPETPRFVLRVVVRSQP